MKLPIKYFTLTAIILIILFTSTAKSASESENREVPFKKGSKSKLDFKRRSHGNGNQKKSFLRRHKNQPGDFEWNQGNQKFQSLDSAPLQYGCTCSCPASSPSYNNYNLNKNQNQQTQQVAGQVNFPQLSQTGQNFSQGGASSNFVGPAPLVQPFIPPSQGQSQGQSLPAAWQGQGQGHSAQSAWQSTESVRPPFPSRSTDVPATRSTLKTLSSSHKGPDPTPAHALDTSISTSTSTITSTSTSENPTTQKVTSRIKPTTHAQIEEYFSNGKLIDISSLAEKTTSTQYYNTDYEAKSSTDDDITYSSVLLPTSNAKVENGSVPISDATSEPTDASRITTVAHSVITTDISAADSTTATTTTEEPAASSSVQSDAEAVLEIENNFHGTINNNVDDYGDFDYYLPIFSIDYDEA